jgi:hypothetical protein
MGSGEQVAQVVGQGLAGEVQGWIVVAQAADAAFFEPLLQEIGVGAGRGRVRQRASSQGPP